jgi:hypothetical protein
VRNIGKRMESIGSHERRVIGRSVMISFEGTSHSGRTVLGGW